MKLGSFSSLTQLCDLFAYDNPTQVNLTKPYIDSSETLGLNQSVLVYQFHSIALSERLNLFVQNTSSKASALPKTLGDLFATASWLEREVSEMYGIHFENKRDIRNLMLQYGDASAPFRKAYPSIGTKEVIFDSVTDTLVQVPAAVQS